MNHSSKWLLAIMRLHDAGYISTRDLLEEMGLNYEDEVKRYRDEVKRYEDEVKRLRDTDGESNDRDSHDY